MVFVNLAGANVWPELQHAEWDGLTFADFVFPMFLFAVGAAVAVSRRPSPQRVVRRVVVLVGAGLLINWLTVPDALRYPGVLQRIAFVYVITVVLARLPTTVLAAVVVALLGGHTWILLDFGAGPAHSLAATVDVAAFGQKHLYGQLPDDPEGLVSSVASVATALIGLLAGRWLAHRRRKWTTAFWLVAVGSLVTLAGWELNLVVAVNKKLWTPSFVLVTAGAGLVVLGLIFLAVECRPFRRCTGVVALAFVVLGTNSLLVYVTSELVEIGMRRTVTPDGACIPARCQLVDGHTWLYEHAFTGWAGPRAGALAFSAALLAVLWVFAGLLYRARVLARG